MNPQDSAHAAGTCTRCGECCVYATYVIVNDEDLARLKPDIDEHELEVRRGPTLSLLRVKRGEVCVFLDQSSGVPVCTIHDRKPSSCRGFCCGGRP